MRVGISIQGIRNAAAYSVLLVGFMLSQCVCQNSRTDSPHPTTGPQASDAGQTAGATPPAPKPSDGATGPAPVTLPVGLDTTGLDDDEKRILHGVLADQYDPCGSPASFLEALAKDDVCEMAKDLGTLAVDKISQGLSKRQVTRALLQEQARRASKSIFDLAGVPFYGDPNTAKHIIVEFTDFQCPYCKRAAGPAKDLAAKFDSVLYVKQLPLEFHTYSKQAAAAALAAHRQGKFWEVYEGIFARQEEISDAVIIEVAKAAGVDMTRWEADRKDAAIAALIDKEIKEAEEAKVGGTPTFFVDGYMVEFENLEQVLSTEK